MRVRAYRRGYYDLKRRDPGDEFILKKENEFSANWMEHVVEEVDEMPKASHKPKPQPKVQKTKPVPQEEKSSDEDVI